MVAQSSDNRLPVRTKIQALLDELGETPAWLATKAGLPRSTVTRLLSGDRNPTALTLQYIAPVLGVTVAELASGTDAAERVDAAKEVVLRAHYDAAVHDVLEYERKANDLGARLRDRTDECERERERRRDAEAQLQACESNLSTALEERDRARREALHNEQDARRYREALEKAVTDVAALQQRVQELQGTVQATRVATGTAVVLAGVAAVASVASYLRPTAAAGETAEGEADE